MREEANVEIDEATVAHHTVPYAVYEVYRNIIRPSTIYSQYVDVVPQSNSKLTTPTCWTIVLQDLAQQGQKHLFSQSIIGEIDIVVETLPLTSYALCGLCGSLGRVPIQSFFAPFSLYRRR